MEAELEKVQQRLNETLARLMRLRRQKEMIVSKGVEMVRRGLKDLDELDEVVQAESAAVVDARLQGAVDVIDWSAIGFDVGFPIVGDSVEVGVVNSEGS
jgi:hypothetical protein